MNQPPPLPKRFAWFAPWTWRRRSQVTAIVTCGLLLWVAMMLRGPTHGLSDVHAMKRAVLRHVPIGTKAADARAFMLQERFQCVDLTNHTFTMKPSDSGGETRHELDFVYCTRTDPAGLLEVRAWGVALVIADDRVTEVLVRASVYGM